MSPATPPAPPAPPATQPASTPAAPAAGALSQPSGVGQKTAPTRGAAERPKLPAGVAATLAILAVAAFVMILNETVLAVALPQLMIEFGVDATAIQWLSTGFMLTMAVVIPTTGFLLQRFTTRSLFLCAVGLFLLGSLLAALAPSFSVMLAARVIQAGGTAVIMPLLMTTTLSSVPPSRRGAIMGMNTIVIACAPAIGPALSGLILGSLGWHAIFWLMVGISVVTLLVGLTKLPAGGATRRVPFDAPSVVLSALGFGGVVYALAGAETALSGSWIPTALGLVVGVLGLVLFVRRQRALQPRGAALMDLRPFSVPTFRLSLITVAITFGLLLGSVVLLSMVLQQGMGLSPMTTGLILLPAGLVQAVLAPFVGRIYDRIGPRPLVIPATVLLAVSMFALAFVTPATPLWVVLLWNTLYGAGMACVLTSLLTTSLSSLPKPLYGHGSAILNTFQQLAGAAGTALLVATMTFGARVAGESGLAGPAAEMSGARWAFLGAGVLCVIAIVTGAMIRPSEPSQPGEAAGPSEPGEAAGPEAVRAAA
ncbi:DHA2 family efflux MFS transporter permease subunit [Galactobacter caseinivorans]|nr:DHA2 family efflux MFS transporter permease subunit [Galactobacter caseinivorans]